MAANYSDVPQMTVAFIRGKAPLFVGDSLTDSVTFGESMQYGERYWRRRSPADDGRRLLGRVIPSAGGPYYPTKPAAENGVVCQISGKSWQAFSPPPLRMGPI